MISIVIPLYNKVNQIEKTLDSVFSQSFQDFEVVIVNDGSTDLSVEKVQNYLESKGMVKEEKENEELWHYDFSNNSKQLLQLSSTFPTLRLIDQPNGGVSKARNTGIENAKYDYIAFLDADDEWKTDYLLTQINLIKKYPEASVYATNYEFHKPGGTFQKPLIRKLKIKGIDGIIENYFEISSYSDPLLWTSAIIVKKESLKSIDGFPLGVKSGEDLLTWAKLASKFKIAYSKKKFATYHQGFSNHRPPEDKDIVAIELEKLWKNYTRVPYLKKYLAYWYKMRMCRLIAHKMYIKGCRALLKSIKYNPFQSKIYFSIAKYLIKGK